jgi:hypothetical protein
MGMIFHAGFLLMERDDLSHRPHNIETWVQAVNRFGGGSMTKSAVIKLRGEPIRRGSISFRVMYGDYIEVARR